MAISTDRVANLNYGAAIKLPVKVATTGSITLAGAQTIDGVAVTLGDRVLVKDQSTASANGIYDVTLGAWSRAVDFDGQNDLVEGTLVYVNQGTVNGGCMYRISTTAPSIGSSLVMAVAARPAATQAQAQAGTDNTALMTPLRVAQAFASGTAGPATATFVGSGGPSSIWINRNVTATSATSPEVTAQFALTSNVGTDNKATAYKIALTAAALGGANSASVYGFNAITQGHAGTYLVTGVESDINNIGADAITLGADTAAYGYVAVAAGSYLSTAGLWITASIPPAHWQLGVAVSDATAASYFENATSSRGIQIAGSHSTAGIDVTGMSGTGYSILLPNNREIGVKDSGGTARNLIYQDSSDVVWVGNGSSGTLKTSSSFLPAIDNTYAMGYTGARWTAIYAANGTIQTSDPTLKTDVKPLPAGLAIVNAVEPKTFRWIEGGNEMVEEEVEEAWHVHEEVERDEPVVEIINGQAVQKTIKVIRSEPVYDEFPIVDEAGKPVLAPGKKVVAKDDAGNVIPGVFIEVPPGQLTHRVPRMGTRKTTRLVPRPKAGARTHWGFMAPDIAAATAPYGDFGGYVKTQDGTEALRPDQLIPILWKAVQELSAKLDALKA